MLKFGICNAREDTPTQRLWRRGLMAASLLAIAETPGLVERERFERLMPQLVLSNGVARTTARLRFKELNGQLQPCLLDAFPRGQVVSVQDWAISNGITAAEWYELLKNDFPRLEFTGSDKLLFLTEVSRQDVRGSWIVEPDGTAIQYIQPPFVVSLVKEQHWLYPVNRGLKRRALERWQKVSAGLRLPDWTESRRSDNTVRSGPFLLRRLPLLHPDVMAISDPQFRVQSHSVFEPLKTPVNVIRSMNILNRAYFTEDQLRQAIQAIEQSLTPGGLWIVGRTIAETPPTHDVTVYRKAANGLETVMRVGNGSEIEPLVRAPAMRTG